MSSDTNKQEKDSTAISNKDIARAFLVAIEGSRVLASPCSTVVEINGKLFAVTDANKETVQRIITQIKSDIKDNCLQLRGGFPPISVDMDVISFQAFHFAWNFVERLNQLGHSDAAAIAALSNLDVNVENPLVGLLPHANAIRVPINPWRF
jgi:uncharacterized protein YlzI (FlbEa/FlbD family)